MNNEKKIITMITECANMYLHHLNVPVGIL